MEKHGKKTICISVAEAAHMLGITRQAVLKKIQSKVMPAHKIGKAYAISMEHVKELLSDTTRTLAECDEW